MPEKKAIANSQNDRLKSEHCLPSPKGLFQFSFCIMDFLEYGDISCEFRGDMTAGRIKLTDSSVQWAPARAAANNANAAAAANKSNIKGDDIDVVNWQRLAGSWGIRMFTKDGNLHRFAGFKEGVRKH